MSKFKMLLADLNNTCTERIAYSLRHASCSFKPFILDSGYNETDDETDDRENLNKISFHKKAMNDAVETPLFINMFTHHWTIICEAKMEFDTIWLIRWTSSI